MTDCVFCRIVRGEAPCHRIWEDEHHLAFLSLRPSTEGFTVVIPKAHHSSYAFELPDEVLSALVLAAKRVGRLLDERLDDVGRTGMIFEGFGVDHVHAKLSPMHGTAGMSDWHPIEARERAFFRHYEGYISSLDGERADDGDLARLAARIRGESPDGAA